MVEKTTDAGEKTATIAKEKIKTSDSKTEEKKAISKWGIAKKCLPSSVGASIYHKRLIDEEVTEKEFDKMVKEYRESKSA